MLGHNFNKNFNTFLVVILNLGHHDFLEQKYFYFIWDKIARQHRKPFGLFYSVETCVPAESFNP